MANFRINASNDSVKLWSKDYWIRVLIMTIAIWIVSASSLVSVASPAFVNSLIAAVIISLLNAFIKPLLKVLSIPFILSTMGLWILVINVIIVYLTDWMMGDRFAVSSFVNALFFSIAVTVISWILQIVYSIYLAHRQLKNTMEGNSNEQYQQENKVDGGFTPYEDVTGENNQNNTEENNK